MIHYMTSQGVGDAWVANELRCLAREGIPFRVHALNKPQATYFTSADIAQLNSATNYIYPISLLAVLASFVAAPHRFRHRFFSALANALFGKRESLRNRFVGIWHLAIAAYWVSGLREVEVSRIHSQWIHSNGTVAMYGAWLLGRPFSFTGHAADLFRERTALVDKITRADFIVCISEFHRQFYLDHGATHDQLFVAYCGLDLSHFTSAGRTLGEDEDFHIISAGRLVEKKGFPVLIRACALLRNEGLKFRCTIAGSGPEETHLRDLISKNGLEECVAVTGQALKQEEIPALMSTGDAFCLHCIWASDNDVDGLPQMLMEAMACGLPSVSTRLVGIPDLVVNGETGLLVEPTDDAVALAEALRRLCEDRDLAARLSEGARRQVEQKFNLETCLKPLINRFKASLEVPQ